MSSLAIIRWELWQRRGSIMWWSIGTAAFITVNLAFYPSFKDQSEQLAEAMSQIPDSAVSLFSDTGEFFSPVGYLSSQVFYLMLPMLLGILSISLGSSLIGREEKENTIELLLSRPVSRGNLLLSKATTGLIIVMGVGLVATIVTVGLAKIVKLEVPSSGVFMASLACIVLALSFGAVAFLISSFGRARIASVGIATLYALGGYIIASLIDAAQWLKWPAKLFPFDYYQPAAIMNSTYNWWNLAAIAAVSIVAITVSWFVFSKRDITN